MFVNLLIVSSRIIFFFFFNFLKIVKSKRERNLFIVYKKKDVSYKKCNLTRSIYDF